MKSMPDFAVWSFEAVTDAIGMSGLDPADLKNERTGLVFGCDSSCLAALEQVDLLTERGETSLIGSGAVFKSMTSCITMNLNTLLETRGACWTLSSACSSGGHAVGQAADLIALGRQDRVLCGGAQEINWQSMCGFDGLGAFSCRLDAPHAASRPFDRDRDGLVPSGGAAAILLENRDLAKEVEAGRFHEALYHRLNIFRIEIPPLRERQEDIPVLTEYFLGHLYPERPPYRISKRTMECFMAYNWPGTVRELRNVIERAIILTKNELLTAHSLPQEIIAKCSEYKELAKPSMSLEDNEKELIQKVLNLVGNNRNEAARILHIGRKTLYRKICKFNIPT